MTAKQTDTHKMHLLCLLVSKMLFGGKALNQEELGPRYIHQLRSINIAALEFNAF
jgi:hypothetical protein